MKEKFDHFVNGKTSGTRADKRIADFGSGPLRQCKYKAEDPRHMHDCKQRMIDAGQANIKEGVTPFYKGSSLSLALAIIMQGSNGDLIPFSIARAPGKEISI